jgi:hypothetical protein
MKYRGRHRMLVSNYLGAGVGEGIKIDIEQNVVSNLENRADRKFSLRYHLMLYLFEYTIVRDETLYRYREVMLRVMNTNLLAHDHIVTA